jgi:hypothetical protein
LPIKGGAARRLLLPLNLLTRICMCEDRYWHEADMPSHASDVCFWRRARMDLG